MVELWPSKPVMRVQFPSLALEVGPGSVRCGARSGKPLTSLGRALLTLPDVQRTLALRRAGRG